MLIEIKSDIFRKKIIHFHSGLNVVLGDEKAANSIGKSNLLLIVDFVLGGDTYLTHSRDVIGELGNHEFYFCFEFDKKYKFKRLTEDAKNVFECGDNYEVLNSISINDFTNFLQRHYNLNYAGATFRALTGVYLRIWGKHNYEPKKPLKTYENDGKEKVGIDNLIKLFGKYDELKEINDRLETYRQSNKILNGMYKNDYATKITKSIYQKNQKEIENIANEIEDIKQNILKYAINTEELINQDILGLKKEKTMLLDTKNKYENKLLRLDRNLNSQSNLSSKHIKKLQEFFPTADMAKIDEIQGFHSKIKAILTAEINNNKKMLGGQLDLIEKEIKAIDAKISEQLENIDNPAAIIDKIHDLTIKLQDISKTNEFFEKKTTNVDEVRKANEELPKKYETIINDLKDVINKKMLEINMLIYNNSNPPVLNLDTSKYSLGKTNDTGTGTAKMNLIIFDLAILELTNLPFLAHDSVVFKDISNEIKERLIEFYSKFKKQIFIAIDEHKKYTSVVHILEERKVVKLDNEHVLFIKKWDSKKNV